MFIMLFLTVTLYRCTLIQKKDRVERKKKAEKMTGHWYNNNKKLTSNNDNEKENKGKAVDQ